MERECFKWIAPWSSFRDGFVPCSLGWAVLGCSMVQGLNGSRSQIRRAERWERGSGDFPRTDLCFVPGTKFTKLVNSCVQNWDRSQLLYQEICRRLKTEILKAVHTEKVDLYPFPPPLLTPNWNILPLVSHVTLQAHRWHVHSVEIFGQNEK